MESSRDPQTGAIIAAAVEVHNSLGHGFLEAVYTHAMSMEMAERSIPFKREALIPVFYKGSRLSCGYKADFISYGSIIVEAKAQAGLTEVDEAQVINYLRGTGLEEALLLNFGTPRLQIKRLILTEEHRHRGVRPLASDQG